MNASYRFLLALTGFILLTACSGGGTDSIPFEPPPPSAQTPTPSANTPAASDSDDSAASSGNSLDSVTRRRFDENGSRDPFQFPQSETPDAIGGGTGETGIIVRECDVAEHPLGLTSYQSLRVTALLTGTAVPRAMVTVDSRPQSLFIQEGMQIGPECAYRVSDIRDNELELTQWSATGEPTEPVTIPLTTDLLEADIEETGNGRDSALAEGEMWLCANGDLLSQRSRCDEPDEARIVSITPQN